MTTASTTTNTIATTTMIIITSIVVITTITMVITTITIAGKRIRITTAKNATRIKVPMAGTYERRNCISPKESSRKLTSDFLAVGEVHALEVDQVP